MKPINQSLFSSVFCVLAGIAGTAHGTNAEFQDFFFAVCESPTGELAERCGETQDDLGDLSGNSEDSLNPNQTTSSNQSPLANARSQIGRAQERVDRLNGEETSQPAAEVSIGPFSLLIDGSFTNFDQDAGEFERGFDGDSWAIELGFDKRLSDKAVVGAFVGWDSSELDFDRDEAGRNFTPQQNSGVSETDTVSFTVFGAYDFSDAWYAEGSLGYSWSEHSFQRNVVFQESTRTIGQTDVIARGDPDGESYWASVGFGYRYVSGSWSATPYAGLNLIRAEIDGYQERDLNGSGLNMIVSDNTRDSFTSALGLRLNKAVSTSWGVLIPQLNVEYQHEFDEDAQSSTTAFVLDASQNTYIIEGDGPDRDYFMAGAGLVAIFPNGWIGFVNYEGMFGYEDRSRHQISLGLRREM
ncbi:MAG: autotransporter outer membrane beta-barrel domain-containing protein [Pseudomonadota bacterium]